jgi:hypothetical protein
VYLTREFSPLLSSLVWSAGLDFPWGLVGPFAVIGASIAVRRAWVTRRQQVLVALTPLAMALAYLAPFIVFAPCARYRYPALFLLLPFATAGALALWRAPSRGRWIALGSLVFAMNLPAPVHPGNAPDDLLWLSYAYEAQANRAWVAGDAERAIDMCWQSASAIRQSATTDRELTTSVARFLEMRDHPSEPMRAMWQRVLAGELPVPGLLAR